MTEPTPPTILIIDNDEGVVRAISIRLESIGYQCITAGTGAQGISLFQSMPVDLIISDLNMPAGDGVTLARSIRETSQVPIICVTGFRDEFRRELRAISNVTVVEKPFNMSELIDLVEADLVLSGREIPVGQA